jgi:3'-phosphoadenosine 5'-phosphosulfate sulfotransferase (PAPS reductase)/FAD synthetase
LKKTFVLSYGAGVNTTALMVLLLKMKMRFDVAVFADTGTELPETYGYLPIAQKYLKEHGVELKVVKSVVGSLYDTCKRRRVVPSKIWRWSTRDYKITPIHHYYKSLGTPICEYLGIGYDEIERLKPSK